MASRKKTQPEQEDALFKERKPRQRKKKETTAAEAGLTLPPPPVGEGLEVYPEYEMPEHRKEAIEDWLNTEQSECVVCGVPLLVRDPRRLTKKGLAHVPCADAIPPFEFPPLVKLFRDHQVLWLDRGYDMFKAGYYHGKLYQCGPGNIYGQFGSFGLDEKKAIEDLGIEVIQIWAKTQAWQITMDEFQDKGEVAQTPPGLRWLVDLEHFQHATRS